MVKAPRLQLESSSSEMTNNNCRLIAGLRTPRARPWLLWRLERERSRGRIAAEKHAADSLRRPSTRPVSRDQMYCTSQTDRRDTRQNFYCPTRIDHNERRIHSSIKQTDQRFDTKRGNEQNDHGQGDGDQPHHT